MSVDYIWAILPEMIIAIYAMLALMVAVFTSKDRLSGLLLWTTAAVFVAVALWIGLGSFSERAAAEAAFGETFVVHKLARFAKVTILLSAAAVLVMSERYFTERNILRFEYPLLIALAVVGMMVMVSANDLMVLYMGLELQSLALYVVTAIRRDSVKGTEAGLKYFVLGALSSGLLLYGASLVYGFTGSTHFFHIGAATHGQASLGLLFGLVFVATGLAFKVSAAPFHMWTPDVYEGAPTPVTAFLATAPKVAAMALFAQVLYFGFGNLAQDWQQIVAFLSVASMVVGSVAAIGQTDIKRMMAYSSIAHMGFALMGLASATSYGLEAMLIYMALYAVMNVGTFAFILMMERDGREITEIAALNGYAKHEPVKALALMILMVSLAGIPVSLGFFGKFMVINAAIQGGLTWLAIAGVIASVVAAFYYLRVIYYVYFGTDSDPMDTRPAPVVWAMLMASALVLVLGLTGVFSGVEDAAKFEEFRLVEH